MSMMNRSVIFVACLLWLVQFVFCEFPPCLTTTPSDSLSLNVNCKKLDMSVEVGIMQLWCQVTVWQTIRELVVKCRLREWVRSLHLRPHARADSMISWMILRQFLAVPVNHPENTDQSTL
ncbi:hypothetical protein OESDEN_02890 [Oesophagostomum dentatum]|uniref:Secreted protein n=1 Tax=Oesophagostomum dentatum TaxID=61180 RepID=A0A0B1THZ8_OESDE|nr:hypothetical protein OESDEN_02890 [Oesophagostomum dentatum]